MNGKISPQKNNFEWPAGSKISYILSLIFIGIGFYKMWFYQNGDSYPYDTINSYVGGDAYNFIINSNYTVAYFILALICVLVGSAIAIIEAITSSAETLSAVNITNTTVGDNPELFNDLPEL